LGPFAERTKQAPFGVGKFKDLQPPRTGQSFDGHVAPPRPLSGKLARASFLFRTDGAAVDLVYCPWSVTEGWIVPPGVV
jgi:hypothetical protein